MPKVELKWGQTPWDNMSKEELLREVQRIYSAVSSLYGVVFMYSQINDPSGPYWSHRGVGGISLEKGRQILQPINDKYSDEDVYRVFYRYANDLLFDSSKYEIGSNWLVCPVCGDMWGTNGDHIKEGMKCTDGPRRNTKCDGVLRKLEWSDLDPAHGEKFDKDDE